MENGGQRPRRSDRHRLTRRVEARGLQGHRPDFLASEAPI